MQKSRQLANLYLLVQVIDAGGLSAAARQLSMTRSMVSRRLLALESELGVRLLHRDARHFSVTPAGEQVYRHALMMCEAAEEATLAARDMHGAIGTRIRIGMDDSLQPLVAELLTAFSTRHPDIRLILGGESASALAKQRVDVVFSADQPTDVADVMARSLARLRWIVVASPALLERLDHPRHPDQLSDQDCMNYGLGDWNLRGTPTRRRQPRLTSSDLPTVLAMAKAGLGFAQLPMYACRNDLTSGQLCQAFEAFEARPRPLHALTRSDPVAGQAVLNLVAFAGEQLAQMDNPGILAAS